MPKLIENLPAQKRAIVMEILSNLSLLEPNAIAYQKEIEQFKVSLHTAPNEEKFFDETTKIIARGKEAHMFLAQALTGLDQTLAPALDECIAEDPKLSQIMNALNFNQALQDNIVREKERLDEEKIYRSLPMGKHKMVSDFIMSLKALEKEINVLNSMKKTFQAELVAASTAEEVNKIEAEIELKNQAMLGIYHQTLLFPEDEEVAGALINHLDVNPRLKGVMESFSFHESLVDDIMSARASANRLARP